MTEDDISMTAWEDWTSLRDDRMDDDGQFLANLFKSSFGSKNSERV